MMAVTQRNLIAYTRIPEAMVSSMGLHSENCMRLIRDACTIADAMLRAVDAALALLEAPREQEGDTMDLKKIFDGFDHAQYEAEAEQRWGNSEAFKESKRRTARPPEEWTEIRAPALISEELFERVPLIICCLQRIVEVPHQLGSLYSNAGLGFERSLAASCCTFAAASLLCALSSTVPSA